MPAKESLTARQARATRILDALRRAYPDATCALAHTSAWELLAATILSAQSTDETVNRLTPALFARYPDPPAMAGANPAEVEEIIHAAGFFRQKTKSLIGAAQTIVGRFGGVVPDKMEDLVQLPGVARKTANVVLGTWFQKNEGVVVDTHVGRLAERLRLCWNHKDSKDAVKIEDDLIRVIPREAWTYLGHALIWHGRRVCLARKPKCADCVLAGDCPSAQIPSSAKSANSTRKSAGSGVSGQRRNKKASRN